jgi:hypothetical protein
MHQEIYFVERNMRQFKGMLHEKIQGKHHGNHPRNTPLNNLKEHTMTLFQGTRNVIYKERQMS